jgi:hypothetical protein
MRRRHIVNLADIGREGRRYHAFYRGYQARRAGSSPNPHKPGSEVHECWQAGWEYACREEAER